MKDKLIIFDMDNTILQSKIDFTWMLKDVYAILDRHHLEKCHARTVSETITKFCRCPEYDKELEDELWRKVCEVEAVGLDKAVGEPGAAEALDYLAQYAEMALLTNNTDEAIGNNLERLGLSRSLHYVAGRNSVGLLKPEPDGMLHVMRQFPSIPASQVITVGDAIIDAQAAERAGIMFVAYNRSRMEKWQEYDIHPLLELHQWDKAACDSIRRLFD